MMLMLILCGWGLLLMCAFACVCARALSLCLPSVNVVNRRFPLSFCVIGRLITRVYFLIHSRAVFRADNPLANAVMQNTDSLVVTHAAWCVMMRSNCVHRAEHVALSYNHVTATKQTSSFLARTAFDKVIVSC